MSNTRLAVLADIHGNLPALEAVWNDAEKQRVDRYIVAGDIIDKGPFPLETIRRMKSLRGWLIRGNGDDYILPGCKRLPPNWRTSSQWGSIRWIDRQLDDEAREYIASLPEQCTVALDGAAHIRVVHCSPGDPNQALFPDRDRVTLELCRKAKILPPERERLNLDAVLMGIDEPVLVCGDTHIPWKQECGERMALCPGPVSLSINGDTLAHYALLTSHGRQWRVEHRAVPYYREQVVAAFRQRGFLDEGGAMARAFCMVIQTGRNVPMFFLHHASALAREAGSSNAYITDEVWERAIETFNWSEWTASRGL